MFYSHLVLSHVIDRVANGSSVLHLHVEDSVIDVNGKFSAVGEGREVL